MLSTPVSGAPEVVESSYSTVSCCDERSSSHTRPSPLVVNHSVPAAIHAPSPPLNTVVVRLRSGAEALTGTHETEVPDTLAAKSDPDDRSPGVVGVNRYRRPAGLSS